MPDWQTESCGRNLQSHVAFLGRLYQAQYRAAKSGWASLKIHDKMNLYLLSSFLKSAYEGISMNNLTFRKPTHIFRSDACKYGLGGYNITSGRAWQYTIPVDCRLRTSLNSLEFLACMITLWVEALENNIDPKSCL
jgi:hypothetical protein